MMLLLVVGCTSPLMEDSGVPPGGDDTASTPAEDDVWDDRYVPVFRITAPVDWQSQLVALLRADPCDDAAHLPVSVAYENPRTKTTET